MLDVGHSLTYILYSQQFWSWHYSHHEMTGRDTDQENLPSILIFAIILNRNTRNLEHSQFPKLHVHQV
jgi:hypothetical protein